MNHCRFIVTLVVVLGVLAACSREPAPQPARPAAAPAARPLSVTIEPDRPTAGDCLLAVVRGQPATSGYRWAVNGQPVAASRAGELCGDFFKRGDRVTVQVDAAVAAVTIGNSPPRVTGISATPKELFAGMDVEVFPVAEDRDGDQVEFRYQWLVNDEADPFLTEAKLPGGRFARGDRLQVRITPFDGESEGPVYSSYVMPVPNAPPHIASRPPQRFEALEYRYQFQGRDPDGDKLAYALAQAPPGMTIDRASGLVVWALAGVPPGAYPVRIVARDPEGAEAFQEFTLTVGTP